MQSPEDCDQEANSPQGSPQHQERTDSCGCIPQVISSVSGSSAGLRCQLSLSPALHSSCRLGSGSASLSHSVSQADPGDAGLPVGGRRWECDFSRNITLMCVVSHNHHPGV